MPKLLTLLLLIVLCNTAFSQWEKRINGLPSWSAVNILEVANDSTFITFLNTMEFPRPICLTTDCGLNWITKVTPESFTGSDIAISNKNNFWFTSMDGKIYYTSDKGDTWELQFNDTISYTFFDFLEVFDENKLIAIGDAPSTTQSMLVLNSLDKGKNWNSVNHSYLLGEWSSDQFFRFSFPSFTVGYFYGSANHKLYKTGDSGTNWAEIPFTGSGIYLVKFYDENLGLIITYEHKTFRTTNSGFSWQQLNIPTAANSSHHDIEFVPGDVSKIWITDYFNLFYSADTGNTWQKINLNDDNLRGRNIEFLDNNIGMLLCDNSKIYVTTNGGITSSKEEDFHIPTKFVLHQNYPNPFNPETTIDFEIYSQSNVKLKVYDVLGKELVTLVNKNLMPGKYSSKFNTEGFDLSSGLYFYSLQAGYFSSVRKMILLK